MKIPAGETEIWTARATRDADASVFLRLGPQEGTTLAAAVSVGGTDADVVLGDSGARSAAAVDVSTSRGDVVLSAVAARTDSPSTPTPLPPGEPLAAEVDTATGFMGLLSVAAAEGGQLAVGAAQEADDWALGAIRLRPTDAPAEPEHTLAYTVDGARASEVRDGVLRRSFSYDAENRLVALEQGDVTSTAAYDGDGLRTSWTSGAGTRTFSYDQSDAVPRVLDDGETSYIYGDNGMPVAQITGDQVRYLLTDIRASVRALADAGAQVVGGRTFGPTGVVEAAWGESSALGFQGQYTDESGLQYLRARYYDPETAAFLTPDPLAELSGSRYGYIVVHELTHLLERGHGDRFVELMDQFMPDWRVRRGDLNRAPLAQESWS